MFDLVKAMIEEIFAGGSTKEIISEVCLDTTSAHFLSMWTTIENIYSKYLVPVGVCLLIIMFFYVLMDKMSTTDVSFTVIGKMVCQLVLLTAFMEVALQMALGIVHFSSLIGNWIAGLPPVTTVQCPNPACMSKVEVAEVCSVCGSALASTTIVDKVVEMFFFTPNPGWSGYFAFLNEVRECTLPMIILFVPWLVTVICEVLVKCVALTRQIEIFVRAAFMPVALGDSYSGLSSTGVKYVKAFFAVCLQGAVIILIMMLSDTFASSYLFNINPSNFMGVDGVMSTVIMPIIYRIATTGLIMKSLPLTKEICGAH